MMKVPFLDRPLRGLVAEHLVVRRYHDLHLFQLSIGDLDRFGAQGDEKVRRGAAFFRTVLGRRLRVQPQNTGQYVGEQFAGGDGPVTAYRVKADAKRPLRQQMRVFIRVQGHEFSLRIGRAEPLLYFGKLGRGVVREKLGSQIKQRDIGRALHVFECCYQVARLQVMGPQAEDPRADLGQAADRGYTQVTYQAVVLQRLEHGMGDQAGQGGDIAPFQHCYGTLAFQRRNQFGLGKRLKQFDGDHTDLFSPAPQIADHGLHVIGGLVAFVLLLMRTRMSKFTPAQATASIVVSYYWHFVDIVWIALFATIYFIR
jgi:hypothetical protein